jgi:uncharacterized protein YjbI with pentapeptide repeats
MANQEHLNLLKLSRVTWDEWKRENRNIEVDLSGADLSKANLHGIDLYRADLSGANLNEVDLSEADLKWADLSGANLVRANLSGADFTSAQLRGAYLFEAVLCRANLSEANLSGANLRRANLYRAYLKEADLRGARLYEANLSRANLSRANLTGCFIYAISAWGVELQDTIQSGLIITTPGESDITVDNLEVAQFIYMLLDNKKIRDVIDTITSKVVLILGRFTSERKKVLDVMRNELRKQNYSPIIFDFDQPDNRDVAETVFTLAHMARFVIADLTDAKSIPQELGMIVPHLPSVPILPIMHITDREWGMHSHFRRYPWVQPIYHYRDLDELRHSIQEHIINPAEKKVRELALEKAKLLERL